MFLQLMLLHDRTLAVNTKELTFLPLIIECTDSPTGAADLQFETTSVNFEATSTVKRVADISPVFSVRVGSKQGKAILIAQLLVLLEELLVLSWYAVQVGNARLNLFNRSIVLSQFEV